VNPAQHVLAIQTAPRPKGSSLERTLAALQSAGLNEWCGPKLIVSDGYSPKAPGWEIDASTHTHGSSPTLIRLLEQAVSRWPDLQMLTRFEDDVIFTRNALTYIQPFVVDSDLAFVSWYSYLWFNGRAREPWQHAQASQVRLFPLNCFFGSLGYTMPRRTVDTLLSQKANWTSRHRCDVFLRCASSPCFGVHYPNLIDHTDGTNSACGNGQLGERVSRSFPGIEFDALTLC